MSRYGIGTSTKSAILADVEKAKEILARSKQNEADRAELLQLLMEAEYQWCEANASARTLEEAAFRVLGAHDVDSTAEAMGKLMHAFDQDVYERVMRETWPF